MRFNKTKTPAMITSHEGGTVYEKSPLEAWMNMLFSSYMENTYYESRKDQANRFVELTEKIIEQYGPTFAAKAAIFARQELGMRSISQLVTAIVNDYSFENKKRFYAAYPHRPDDVAEVFAAIESLGSKRSHALVRGFADYLSGLSEYSLGKYKMNNREYTMYDCINITHANSKAINKYKEGNLRTPQTWETVISKEQSTKEREQNWLLLVQEGKLGYLALLRNLRNILTALDNNLVGETDAWLTKYLFPQIVDETAIEKSLIFPYQIYAAYVNLSSKWKRDAGMAYALDIAFRISAIKNMPRLKGNTCIMLDVSGSMDQCISEHSKISIKEVGAVYAAAIAFLAKDLTFIKFGTHAERYHFSDFFNGGGRNLLIFNVIERMAANDGLGYGTQFDSAIEKLTHPCDRIILISDMQIMTKQMWYPWQSNYNSKSSEDLYKDYCRKYGNCALYSFDLGNYHGQIGNPNNPNVHLCTALNEKVLKFMSLLENGEKDLRKLIESYSF